MQTSIGITTFVHGWYVEYLPFFIHSISKSYPEYNIKIFIQDELKDNLKKRLPTQANCKIEQLFSKHETNDPSKKPYYLRWFLPYEKLKEFDSAFICDVDLLMLREKRMMHEQRENICDKINYPFANFIRNPSPNLPKKITGWHYIRVKPYYEKMTNIIDQTLNDPNFDISNPPSYSYFNGFGEKQYGQEAILYKMMKSAFQFEDEEIIESKIGFPNHHGIHMGPFRGKIPELVESQNSKGIKHINKNLKYWKMHKEILEIISSQEFALMRNQIKHLNVKEVVRKVCGHFQSKALI